MNQSLSSITFSPKFLSHQPLRWLTLAFGILLLAAGGWVYVAERPGTIIYSLCHEPLGIPGWPGLPEFVRFCLPNGLWSLASILVLHPLLAGEPRIRRLAIIAIIPLLGVVSEILQAAGILPGVFDPLDLACYALPLIIYPLLQFIPRINTITYE